MSPQSFEEQLHISLILVELIVDIVKGSFPLDYFLAEIANLLLELFSICIDDLAYFACSISAQTFFCHRAKGNCAAQ